MSRASVVFLSVLATSGLLLTSCVRQGTPTATPTPHVVAPPTATPTPTAAAKPTTTPTPHVVAPPTVTPTPTAAAKPTTTPTDQEPVRPPFFLRVTSPQHEAIVTTATIVVSGDTTVDAAVSVNGQFVEVDALGRFKATVTLVQGVNTIDVVGSDFTGRRVSAEVLTVLYIPG